LNKMDMTLEISDTQAVATLLRMDTEVNSDAFTLVGIWEAVAYNGCNVDANTPMGAEESDGTTEVYVGNNVIRNACRTSTNEEQLQQQLLEMTAEHHDNNWGPSTIYHLINEDTGQKEYVAIPFPEHYNYRGEQLRNLNRIEYGSFVKLERRKEETTKGDGKEKPGRKRSTAFPLGDGHKLINSHDQILRSKQLVPILTKKPPEVPIDTELPPSDDPLYTTIKKKLDTFACYWLTAIRPEVNHFDATSRETNGKLNYDWIALKEYIAMIKNSDLGIHQARYQLYRAYVMGMKVTPQHKEVSSKYRRRNVDWWDQQDREDGIAYWGEVKSTTKKIPLEFTEIEVAPLTEKEIQTIQEQTQYEDSILSELGKLAQSAVTPSTMALPQLYPVYAPSQITDVEESLFKKKEEKDNPCSDTQPNVPQSSLHTEHDCPRDQTHRDNCNHAINTRKHPFSASQKRILNKFVDVQCDFIRGNFQLFTGEQYQETPHLYLCTGPPGTGKTTTINFFETLLKNTPEIKLVTATMMGSSAIQANGRTIHNLLGITGQQDFHADAPIPPLNDRSKLEQILINFQITRSEGHKSVILVLDEISMVTTVFLALLDSRLRQAVQNESPFGGIPVFLFGDFKQIEPVMGESLAQASVLMAEYDINQKRTMANRYRAAKGQTLLKVIPTTKGKRKKTKTQCSQYGHMGLFSKSIYLPMEEQMRSIDPNHTAFI